MKSQLRIHIKFSLGNRIRAFFQKMRLGLLGTKVYIDKNVEFMRFPKNIFIGNEVIIKEGAKLCSCNRNALINIGERTTIGYHTFIFSSKSIYIGADCLIAPFVYIVDSNHQIKRGKKINQQQNDTLPITIGNDVWIASNVTILKGVNIGEGAVIAANSVVNTNIESYAIFGGTPAKKIGERV